MPYFGSTNLEQHVENCKSKLNERSIISLAITLINAVKIVHKAGYVYNDLKLDNILVSNKTGLKNDPGALEGAKIHLVDFGFASKYYNSFKTADGIKHSHVAQEDLDCFTGNMINASIDLLDFKTPSRRDDLISLCYMLCSLFRGGSLPMINDENLEKMLKEGQNET
jgi:serine/threonine protein kinase